jgi:undecaprenyl diphosphate synthase
MSSSPQEGLWVELTCDGNRRYEAAQLNAQGETVRPAELTGLPLYLAYKAGGNATKQIIEVARDNAVGLIAPWAWSTKNWDRPKEHADTVFRVTEEFLEDLETDFMHRPENNDVRLVHVGRQEGLQEAAPRMMETLRRISEKTRNRSGMVIALLLDHSGPDELERAIEAFKVSGCKGHWTDYLDLSKQGVPYKEVDLRIRTGEETRIKHINAVMKAHDGLETREIFREEMLPMYTADLFREDLEEFQRTEKRQGK